MQHASNIILDSWCVLRKCVQHAALVRPGLRSQQADSTQRCSSFLQEFTSAYVSDQEGVLRAQKRQVARQYTTETSPSSPVSKDSAGQVKPGGHSRQSKTSHSRGSVVTILDDSQHPIRAGSVPSYAWPVLLDLKLAGIVLSNSNDQCIHCKCNMLV